MAEHTKLPWTVAKNDYLFIDGADGCCIARIYECDAYPHVEANAEIIVRAVNCHHDLLEACRFLVKQWDDFDDGDLGEAAARARDAIAKAEGK